MGHWIKLKSADGFEPAAWRAEPKGTPRGADRRHPGDFRRQPSHPFRDGSLRRRGLSRDRAGDLRPRRTRRGTRLRTGGQDARHGDRRQGRSRARDAGRRRGDRGGGRGRQGRHRRLLHGRHICLDRLGQACGPVGGGRLLRRRDHRPEGPEAPGSDHAAFRRAGRPYPGGGRSRGRGAHPDVPVFIYPAGHGFHCDERASYDAPSAALAWGRTLEFFGKHLG